MNHQPLKKITFVLGMLFMGLPYAVYADTEIEGEAEELETVHVQGRVLKKPDVTGLGEIKKIAGKLQREQVENIRDLVRYDPGIGVNESGGRGTSRGYSIRGVEKERVAVEVDGMGSNPMVRRWSRNSAFAKSSGAQNEIEYENLKEVDIRKGAASLEGGSGALGGSVSATTKELSDILDDGQLFGGRFKTGYTSKDERKMGSLALGLRMGNVEGFVQYTKRKGHEIKAHKELYEGGAFITNRSDNGDRWFSAKDVSGINPNSGGVRNVPNPMDYDSSALLSKFGWHITPSHYLGAVVENTRQTYHVREMFFANYWDMSATPTGLQPEDYLVFGSTGYSESLKYTPSRFYDDKHDNKRMGLEYRYRNPGTQRWLPDALTVQFDHRRLKMSTTRKDLACATWPTVDPNCQLTQVGQISKSTATFSDQIDNRLSLTADKQWQFKEIAVQSKLKLGHGHMRYSLADYEYAQRIVNRNGGFDTAGDRKNPLTAGPIHGKHSFIALNNRIDFNNGLSASGGIRYDRHTYSASPTEEQIKNGSVLTRSRYGNYSWDLGLNYAINDNLSIVYRNSSGFRVPSVIEQLGPYFASQEQVQATDIQPPLKAEKSLNNEIGLKWNSTALKLSASYFWSNYRNLIDRARLGQGGELYHNLHNVKTQGFELSARLDAYSVWNKLPEGLEAFATISQTKQRGTTDIDPRYTLISSYTLDAIQPFRIVYGVSYNHPDDKWGVNLTTTYSKGKNPDELKGASRQGGLSGTVTRSSDVITKSWAVTDLTGHYRLSKNSVLRAGVYNIFNHRYITWESARQTAYGLDVRIPTNNYLALAAPGRNYQVSFEWKF